MSKAAVSCASFSLSRYAVVDYHDIVVVVVFVSRLCALVAKALRGLRPPTTVKKALGFVLLSFLP